VKKVLLAEQKKATNNQSAMIYDQYIQNLKKLAGTRKSQSRERGGGRTNSNVNGARDRSTGSQRYPNKYAQSSTKINNKFGFNASGIDQNSVGSK
jgi:hypothetical protein